MPIRFVGEQDPEYAGVVAAVPENDQSGQETVVREPALYVEGVPARDLSDDEWAALTDEQRAAAEASGLYEVGDAQPPRPAPNPEPAPQPEPAAPREQQPAPDKEEDA